MLFKDKIIKIMGKAIDITENSDADVFVEYSAHCSLFEVRIYTLGWESNNCPDFKFKVYLDNPKNGFGTYDDVNNELDIMLDKLDSMSQSIVAL